VFVQAISCFCLAWVLLLHAAGFSSIAIPITLGMIMPFSGFFPRCQCSAPGWKFCGCCCYFYFVELQETSIFYKNGMSVWNSSQIQTAIHLHIYSSSLSTTAFSNYPTSRATSSAQFINKPLNTQFSLLIPKHTFSIKLLELIYRYLTLSHYFYIPQVFELS
jgi:hypothetical protein